MPRKPEQPDLIFTQARGFEDYLPPKRFREDGPKNEDWDDWLKRVGLRELRGVDRRTTQYLVERHYDETFTVGAFTLCEVLVRKEGDPRYRLIVRGAGFCADHDSEIVWVPTRGDLMALRIELSRLMQVELLGTMGDLRILMQRMFMAVHGSAEGHRDADDVCRLCDPQEARDRVRDREEARKKKATLEK